jgi:Carbohydrate family 9 binding domain-like
MKQILMSMLVICVVAGCYSNPGASKTETKVVRPVGKPGVNGVNKDSIIALKMATKAAKIDGKLTDSTWKNAVLMTDFTLGKSGRPAVKTSVFVTYDKDNLYIAVVNDEPNTSKLKANAVGRDGKIWNDDSVEIYIDPKNQKDGAYFGFFVNSKNSVYDRSEDGSWNGKWTSGASVVPGQSWTVEVAVPFKTLGVTPKPGHKLGLMVARTRCAGLDDSQNLFLVPCREEAKSVEDYPVLELK